MAKNHSIGDQLRGVIRKEFLPRRHSTLLVMIITLLGVRPLVGATGAGPALYSVVIMLVLMVALYTIQVDELLGDREVLLKQRKTRATVGWALAIVAIVLRLTIVVSPNHEIATAGAISWLLFFGFVTLTELRGVLKQKQITRESISMAVSVYLLIGLTWGLFFILLFDFQPHAFSFGSAPVPAGQEVAPVLIYFSLTTLATVGYGDITPVTLQARYAAVSEGIAGQFYLAILVARLVGMQMTQAASPDESAKLDESDTK
jgi:amino acid transporter